MSLNCTQQPKLVKKPCRVWPCYYTGAGMVYDGVVLLQHDEVDVRLGKSTG